MFAINKTDSPMNITGKIHNAYIVNFVSARVPIIQLFTGEYAKKCQFTSFKTCFLKQLPSCSFFGCFAQFHGSAGYTPTAAI